MTINDLNSMVQFFWLRKASQYDATKAREADAQKDVDGIASSDLTSRENISKSSSDLYGCNYVNFETNLKKQIEDF